MKLSAYIDDLTAHGKCTFTLDDALAGLNKSRSAVIKAIQHLKKKKEIVSPAKGFYVIVDPEYRIYGCLPAEYFIPYLMKYWQQPYYAGLLTAAEYHGAAHQKPQTFQIITTKKKPAIQCGKIKIEFLMKEEMKNLPLQSFSTAKSILNVSTPEVTAMDLVCYHRQSGGFNQIVTVLAELCEFMNSDKLLALAENSLQIVWKQRLGFLLEQVGALQLADALQKHLSLQKRVDYVLLAPSANTKNNCKRDTKWKIIMNTMIEGDV